MDEIQATQQPASTRPTSEQQRSGALPCAEGGRPAAEMDIENPDVELQTASSSDSSLQYTSIIMGQVHQSTFEDADTQLSDSASSTSSSIHFEQHPIYEHYDKCVMPSSSTGTESSSAGIDYRCKYCVSKATIIKVKGSTTTNLLRHIERVHVHKYATFEKKYKAYQVSKHSRSTTIRSVPEPKQKSMLTYMKRKANMHPKDKRELDEALALMIAKDSQPLSVVEDEGFQSFVNRLNPDYEIPSRKNLTYSILPKLEKSIKKEVVLKLQKAKFVSLTFDMWTSRATDAYMALTCHILEHPQCIRKNFCLGVRYFPDRHTAENIVEQLSLILGDFNIPLEKVASVTTDNGSNGVKAIDILGLSDKHIRCMGHCFHLIVMKALKDVRSVERIVDKCRTISKFFKNSAASKTLLAGMQFRHNLPETKLKIDVVTRWNSIYDMAKRILEQDIAINAALSASAHCTKGRARQSIPQTFTVNELDILRDVLEVLQPYLVATEKLSGQAYVTCSMVIPIITEMQASLGATLEQHTATERPRAGDDHDSDDENLREEETRSLHSTSIRLLCRTLKDYTYSRFEHIEDHIILGKTTVLDPRFKTFGFQEQHKADVHVKQLGAELQELMTKSSGVVGPEPELGLPSPKKKAALDFWKVLSKRKSQSKTAVTHSSELDLYLAEEMEDYSTDVFEWWGRQTTRYPLLSQLAFKYLCGTATSVPSEQLFSKTGEIVSSRRACLKPAHVEMLTFIKTNLSQCH